MAEIEGARDLRAPPSIGPSVLFRDHSPRPEDGPLEGRHRRLPQMSPAHARHFGAAELRLISQPRRLLEALAWEIARTRAGPMMSEGSCVPIFLCGRLRDRRRLAEEQP